MTSGRMIAWQVEQEDLAQRIDKGLPLPGDGVRFDAFTVVESSENVYVVRCAHCEVDPYEAVLSWTCFGAQVHVGPLQYDPYLSHNRREAERERDRRNDGDWTGLDALVPE